MFCLCALPVPMPRQVYRRRLRRHTAAPFFCGWLSKNEFKWSHLGSQGGLGTSFRALSGPGASLWLTLGAFGKFWEHLGSLWEALVGHLASSWVLWGALLKPWGSFGRPWWAIWAHFGSFGGYVWSLGGNFLTLRSKIAMFTKTFVFLRFFNDLKGLRGHF